MKKPIIVAVGLDDFNPGVVGEKSGELALLDSLKKKYAKIKITCFCSPAYSYTDGPVRSVLAKTLLKATKNERIKKKNFLSNNRAWVRAMKKRKYLSLEMHGYTHISPRTGRAAEFEGLGKEETFERLESSIKEFKKAGLHPKVFSPPGWKLNEFVFEFSRKKRIAIASSFFNMKTRTFSGEALASGFEAEKKHGVKCIPRNIDIGKGTLEEAGEAAKKGFLSFHGHTKSIGVGNGITRKNISNLEEMLAFIEKKYAVRYKFFKEL